MSARRHVTVVVLALAAMTACGGDDDASDSVVPVSVPTAPDSTVPASTEPQATATSAPATTPPTTAAPTTEPCPVFAGSDPVVVGFPNTLSSLVGREIRTGGHSCFERVVLELQGDGTLPGYKVEYVDDPVRLSPSDLEVEIAGDATLVLSVGSWMTTMEGDGYQGPDQIFPTNVEHIAELRLIENFEGMHQWAIGLDAERSFEVTTLSDPYRIVIDVET